MLCALGPKKLYTLHRVLTKLYILHRVLRNYIFYTGRVLGNYICYNLKHKLCSIAVRFIEQKTHMRLTKHVVEWKHTGKL